MSNSHTTAAELFTTTAAPTITDLDDHYATLPVELSSRPSSKLTPRALEIRGVLVLLGVGGLGYAGLRAVSYLQYGA
jgi:hypothetical protein